MNPQQLVMRKMISKGKYVFPELAMRKVILKDKYESSAVGHEEDHFKRQICVSSSRPRESSIQKSHEYPEVGHEEDCFKNKYESSESAMKKFIPICGRKE
ncbi:hypothetical protein CEXT_428571 [Caerostris extrusa]|uniref:Uncharacterized protein n=1 Tax=Caerostris extrusa TaxID=172846 RepID=A0AAV4R9Y5_CAEEX|nr:hypothetical protein CEXT_428571 [Caerostris extrusa]